MIEHHLVFEDFNGAHLRVEPADMGRLLLLSATDPDPADANDYPAMVQVALGPEEASHLVLHLAAYLARHAENCGNDEN